MLSLLDELFGERVEIQRHAARLAERAAERERKTRDG